MILDGIQMWTNISNDEISSAVIWRVEMNPQVLPSLLTMPIKKPCTSTGTGELSLITIVFQGFTGFP